MEAVRSTLAQSTRVSNLNFDFNKSDLLGVRFDIEKSQDALSKATETLKKYASSSSETGKQILNRLQNRVSSATDKFFKEDYAADIREVERAIKRVDTVIQDMKEKKIWK